MNHTFPTDFSPPVKELITMGEKNTRGTGPWLDYQDQGITPEHIPELIRILQEIELFWPLGDTESPEVSAPIHAWRALGQLKATQAIPALIELVVQNEELESDWLMEEIPKVMGMLGPVCIPALREYLQDPNKLTWASVTVGHCLAEVGKQNLESRADCVAALQAGLEQYTENDETINAFMISYLAELNAAEAAPLVELAYQADRVDLSVMGDFEEYQIAVGLLKKRLTPPPRYGFFDYPQAQWEADKKSRREEERRQRQKAQKEKKKRKQAKKTRRGKRGKKRK
jgi:hypothetical protein